MATATTIKPMPAQGIGPPMPELQLRHMGRELGEDKGGGEGGGAVAHWMT